MSNIRRETDVHSSRPALVANDEHSSTVIFVGKGPTTTVSSPSISMESSSSGQPVTTQSRVLYVASTFVPSPLGPRDALDVPSVSSVSLDSTNLFDFTSQTISSGTVIKLDYINRPHFP